MAKSTGPLWPRSKPPRERFAESDGSILPEGCVAFDVYRVPSGTKVEPPDGFVWVDVETCTAHGASFMAVSTTLEGVE